jgi:N-formylglutamate amidohydrolase
VPTPLYQKDLRVHAIMVEVNRSLYMNEESGARLDCFNEVRERLGRALRALFAAEDVGTHLMA